MEEYIKKSDVLEMLSLPPDILAEHIYELKGVWLDKEKFVKLTTSESGDWQILEVDGVEWASGHSISENDWLGLISEHFDGMIERATISDEEIEARC